jgi:mono/diheme cytochrome c family protein
MPSRRAFRQLVLLVPLVAASGCEWFSDFKRQPHVVTWESWRPDSLGVRGSPVGSVPTVGTQVAGFTVSYGNSPATIDSMSGIVNPVAITQESLAAGHILYQINCAVCHGDDGTGLGLATRYGFVPIPLTSDIAKGRSDGYLFGMIRNGRGLMPSYNRIEERDRWDVVNYVRALQGFVTNVPFERGPVALPGVTGTMVPGASELGPTRAIPHRPTPGGAR